MATTPKGIYYPNDYNEIADIPEDMKKMAESIEEVFEDTDSDLSDIKEEQTTQNNRLNSLEVDNTTNKSDILTNKQEINNIKTEQTEQNTNISTNATNIESLQEENENLKKIVSQLPQVEGQGTSITLENTIEAQFTIFDEEGNSTQETTTGKNLLNFDSFSSTLKDSLSTLRLVVSLGEQAQTVYTNNSQPIGKISFSFTPNSDYSKFVIKHNGSSQDIRANINFNFVSGTTYYMTLNITGNNPSVVGGFSFDKVMISTVEGDYEPYTGGIASPNPSYEQPIYSAGDNENLCDGINQEYWLNTTTLIAGKLSGNTGLIIPVDGVSKYTISTKIVQTRYRVACIDTEISSDGSETAYNGQSQDNTNNSITIDTTGHNYLLVNATSLENIKIEKGTKVTPYSPYGMGSINEKIQTSNLIDIIRTLGTPSNTGYDNTNKRTFDVTTLIKFLTANNYYNAGVQIDYSLIDKGIKITTKQAGYGIGFPVILNSAKTYTISANIDVIDNQMIRAIFYKEDGTYISNVTNSGTNKFLTFTTTDDTYFVVVMLTPKANVETTYSNIMLNEGNTALPYVEHQEQDYSIFVQQPMRSIGDVRDCFVNINGNWFERHYILQEIYDGSDDENWQTNVSDGIRFLILLNSIKVSSIPLSNFFKGTTNLGYLFENGYLVNPASKNISFCNSSITTLAEWKNWLSTHNVVVQYELEEPLDLPCTPEQIQQLENLPSTYKDFTIIQSEDETPAYLEVSGIYDLNKLITRTEVLESEV